MYIRGNIIAKVFNFLVIQVLTLRWLCTHFVEFFELGKQLHRITLITIR